MKNTRQFLGYVFVVHLDRKHAICYAVGASLLLYQVFVYHWLNKVLGPVNSIRIASVGYYCHSFSLCRFSSINSSVYFCILTFSIPGDFYTTYCCLSLYDTLIRTKTWHGSI